MKEREPSPATPASDAAAGQQAPGPAAEFHGVRYLVKDVARSVSFYTQHLGFKAGLKLRNETESGPGGKQIQVEDPDGNPIELFEPAAR